MKKTTLFRAALVCLAAVLCLALFAGCSGSDDDKLIRVGGTVTPHCEILEQVRPILEEQGYTVEIVQFDDYVLPNNSTEDGELLANFFQHQLYLDDFNEANGTHLVSVADIHYEPFGIYPGKTASLEELQDGATIAIPNDGTNEARALLLLEARGLIKLREDAGFTATKLDIEENPKNLDIVEMEAAQLPRVLPDVDFALINGNYALQGGLKVTDALAVESGDVAINYANVLVVKEGNENNPGILALVEALKSDEVRKFVDETYNGAVVIADGTEGDAE